MLRAGLLGAAAGAGGTYLAPHAADAVTRARAIAAELGALRSSAQQAVDEIRAVVPEARQAVQTATEVGGIAKNMAPGAEELIQASRGAVSELHPEALKMMQSVRQASEEGGTLAARVQDQGLLRAALRKGY